MPPLTDESRFVREGIKTRTYFTTSFWNVVACLCIAAVLVASFWFSWRAQ